MNYKKSMILVAGLLGASACTSSISTFSDVKADGKSELEIAKSKISPESKFSNIRYVDELSVPELRAGDLDKPEWFFSKVKGSYVDYTIAEIMRDEVLKHKINVRYVDDLDSNHVVAINHDGELGGLLDKISFATKYSYEIDGDLLTWSKFKTEKIDVDFIAGTTEYLFGQKEGGQVNAAGGSGTSTGVVTDTGFNSTDDYINFSTKDLSVWSDLEATIKMLKSKDGEFVVNQATSSVVIKDFPDHVAAIKNYIENENEKLTKMVAVDIEVIEFKSNEGDQRGVNWKVVKQDLASSGVLGFKTAFTSLIQDDLAPAILGYSKTSGKYAGSEVLINVLDKYGAVSSSKKKRVVSLNNQVSKIINGNEIGYLQQSGGTATANVGSQDNLIGGVLKIGDSIYMLPNAVDDNIVIQLSSKMSALDKLREVSSGERTIETPETSLDELFLKFAVKEGQTLLISGNSSKRKEYNENTTAGLWFLGGELGGSESTTETLVLLTPRVIN